MYSKARDLTLFKSECLLEEVVALPATE